MIESVQYSQNLRAANAASHNNSILYRERFTIPHLIDPYHPERARDRIILPHIPTELIEHAHAIADGIKALIAPSGVSAIHSNKFARLFSEVADSQGRSALSADEALREALLTLSAYFCIKKSGAPAAFLSGFPGGMFDGDILQSSGRAGIALRYGFTEGLGLNSARDLERFTPVRSSLVTMGLATVGPHEYARVEQLIEWAFPDILQGEDPVVRPWLLDIPHKWKGFTAEALVPRAMAWTLKYGIRATYTDHDGTAKVDLDKLTGFNWSEFFETYGLRGIVNGDSIFRSFRDALDAGGCALGCGALVGYGEEKIRPEILRTSNRWADRHQFDLEMYDLAHALLEEHVRPNHPELFSDEGRGALIPQRARGFKLWHQYLRTLGVNVVRAGAHSINGILHSGYPELFGWEVGKLKPWDLHERNGKWDGPEGRQRFVTAFAFFLVEQGLGHMRIHGEHLDYELTAAQFERWSKTPHRLQDAITEAALSGGLRNTCSTSIGAACCYLFGETDLEETYRKVGGYYYGRIVPFLLEERGGALRKTLLTVSKEEALLLLENNQFGSVQDEPQHAFLAAVPALYLHRYPALLTRFDRNFWQELRTDPATHKELRAAFFANRSLHDTALGDVLEKNTHPGIALLAHLHQIVPDRRYPYPWVAGLLTLTSEKRALLPPFLQLLRASLGESLNLSTSGAAALTHALKLLDTSPFQHEQNLLQILSSAKTLKEWNALPSLTPLQGLDQALALLATCSSQITDKSTGSLD